MEQEFDSEGRRRLIARFSSHGDQAAFARQSGIKENALSRYASGQRNPDAAARGMMDEATKDDPENEQLGYRLWDIPPVVATEGAA